MSELIFAPTIEAPHEYWAGSDGRIYSLTTEAGPKPLTDKPANRYGHRKICLWRVGPAHFWVHRLVCGAFHGPCPTGRECSHLNGKTGDNRPENLAWETPAQNNRRKIAHGTFGVKLTEQQAAEIKRRWEPGYGNAARLGREFGVSSTMVSYIAHGKSWRHL